MELEFPVVNVTSEVQLDFYRTRGRSVVLLHRKRGGVNGTYRCEIPDALGVTQTIYIEASTGEWYMQTVHTAECLLQKQSGKNPR